MRNTFRDIQDRKMLDMFGLQSASSTSGKIIFSISQKKNILLNYALEKQVSVDSINPPLPHSNLLKITRLLKIARFLKWEHTEIRFFRIYFSE